jgi:hypothetical protein
MSRKSVQWEPSYSMRAEGQTHMKNLSVAFRNTANTPEKKQEENGNQKFCS